jgi:hypothetical protein
LDTLSLADSGDFKNGARVDEEKELVPNAKTKSERELHSAHAEPR